MRARVPLITELLNDCLGQVVCGSGFPKGGVRFRHLQCNLNIGMKKSRPKSRYLMSIQTDIAY